MSAYVTLSVLVFTEIASPRTTPVSAADAKFKVALVLPSYTLVVAPKPVKLNALGVMLPVRPFRLLRL